MSRTLMIVAARTLPLLCVAALGVSGCQKEPKGSSKEPSAGNRAPVDESALLNAKSKAFLAAMKLLKQGKNLEAEQVALAEAKRVKREHGAQSVYYAKALFDLASVQIGTGDLSRGEKTLRQSCDVKAPGRVRQKQRLTCLMNLGDIQRLLRRYEDAEQTLRSGLKERLTFYGASHAGYAYGAQPLADVLYARGKKKEALPLINTAVAIYSRLGHKELPYALAVQASIRVSLGKPPFAKQPPVAGSLLAQVTEAVLDRVETDATVNMLTVLRRLAGRIQSLQPARKELWTRVLGATSNLAKPLGKHKVRRTALQQLLQYFDQAGNATAALTVVQGLAIEATDSKDNKRAGAHYVDAIARAERLGKTDELASVLRNHALFLYEMKRTVAAEKTFRRAMKVASRAKVGHQLARVRAAYGIMLQHQGRYGEVKPHLEAALKALPVSHPDRLYVRTHLSALKKKRKCDCGKMNQAVARELEAMVRKKLPAELVESIKVTLDKDGKPDFAVKLARKPTAAERELVDMVTRQALARLRQKIHGQGNVQIPQKK